MIRPRLQKNRLESYFHCDILVLKYYFSLQADGTRTTINTLQRQTFVSYNLSVTCCEKCVYWDECVGRWRAGNNSCRRSLGFCVHVNHKCWAVCEFLHNFIPRSSDHTLLACADMPRKTMIVCVWLANMNILQHLCVFCSIHVCLCKGCSQSAHQVLS